MRVVAREHVLDRVLEREVEGLGREVPDDVGEVAAPEGRDALLGGDAGEAVGVFRGGQGEREGEFFPSVRRRPFERSEETAGAENFSSSFLNKRASSSSSS